MLANKVMAKHDETNANNTNSRPDLLQRYYNTWREYSQGIQYLHKLYNYLNQQHIKKQKITDTDTIRPVRPSKWKLVSLA
ncbi:cullin-2-like [Drosophila navojoa]|uniref:cullin-2-like n=1 Tax=Drosophila navojoa TaxID=7232 RepID=UPI0011BE42E6|nr:cullin-2-like [Drosophila navojoa]